VSSAHGYLKEDQMFKRILCATDGSGHGDRALREGARIARTTTGELHVVHVTERIPGGGRLHGQTVFVTEPEIEDRIRRQVDEIACDEGVSVHVHMLTGGGQPARRLAALAARIDADLIVLGTRGHSPLAGLVLGSVTQHLLHEAGRPVLALPPERGAEPVSASADAPVDSNMTAVAA
jgi:nucleotide-binding universal stress UspA family protein